MNRTSLDDLAALNAELAALVRARIPLEPELRRLAPQLPKRAGALANRLAERMESGSDLATAMEAERDQLPEVYRAVMIAGLESGDPTAALEDVAESAGRLAGLRQTTGLALVMPVAVVIVASVLLSVLLQTTFKNIAWIAPDTLGPYQAAAQDPWLRWVLAVLVPLLAIVVPCVWWWRSRAAVGWAASRWGVLGWIPGGRRLHRLTSSATFAEVLRMMVASGAPLDRSLTTAAQSCANRRFRRAGLALAEHSRGGGDLADRNNVLVAKHSQQLPPQVRVALRHCGHQDVFASSLAQAASSYQARAAALSSALSDYIPALLTLGVAGTVTAAYTIGLLWPYTVMLYTLSHALWQ